MTESPTLISVDSETHGPGDLIGQKYRLERLLGEGAQGSVWLAENVALGASVAIKLVQGEPTNPSPILRLEREARAAAQIAHPAVVRVFDLGRTPNGDAFIVMEFLEGENLGERLTERGRLSAVEAVRTLLPIADVLQVAHARGIVHRDLKPDNVFLAESGVCVQPKLLDFGIAKLRRGEARSDGPITEVGMLVGSPAYLSPEQALCRSDVAQAADIWSFCVVLYECITGRLPFVSNDCFELFRRIGEDAPEPILAHGVGDFELWEILRRGLAKNPDERWPSIEALGRALAAWLRARGVRDDLAGVLLDAKWLAPGRTLPLKEKGRNAASSVRRIGAERTDPVARFTERPPRTRASRGVIALGAVAFVAALLAAHALVTGWATTARTEEASVVIEPGRPAPPKVAALAAPTSLSGNGAPAQASSAEPMAETEPGVSPIASTALPRVRAATNPPERTPAPPPKRTRRERSSDLLDPY